MEEKPVIEFPVEDYPIKVIGAAGDGFLAEVAAIVRGHDEAFAADTVVSQPSSRGTYVSLRLSIRATSEGQLKALHTELMAHPLVKLVL
jgi:putative lipoic acid-binding regulatory protein